MHGIHDSATEDASLEEIRRCIRIQLSLANYHHHCIPPASISPNGTDNGLHLSGNHIYCPHADSSQLFTHLRDNTEPATDHQQLKHTLRRYGRIDLDRIKFELRYTYHGRTTLISQRQSPQQPGKRARHGSTQTVQAQNERQQCKGQRQWTPRRRVG